MKGWIFLNTKHIGFKLVYMLYIDIDICMSDKIVYIYILFIYLFILKSLHIGYVQSYIHIYRGRPVPFTRSAICPGSVRVGEPHTRTNSAISFAERNWHHVLSANKKPGNASASKSIAVPNLLI